MRTGVIIVLMVIIIVLVTAHVVVCRTIGREIVAVVRAVMVRLRTTNIVVGTELRVRERMRVASGVRMRIVNRRRGRELRSIGEYVYIVGSPLDVIERIGWLVIQAGSWGHCVMVVLVSSDVVEHPSMKLVWE